MRMVLASQSAADRANMAPTGERLINCYSYPAPEGSIAPLIIRSVPGTRSFVTLPGPFLRALTRVEDTLYAISAGGLHKVNADGTTSYLAAIPDDPNTVMVGHRSSITITAGGNYFVWNGSSLTQPAGGPLTSIGSVAFLDQFTLLSEKDGRRVEWTAAGLPQTRNGLYFATAEARDDAIIRLMVSGSYLLVLKQYSTEQWFNTGLGAASAYKRIEGGVLDRGLRAFNLCALSPEGVFMVGTDQVAYYAPTGGLPQPVSPANVNQALRDGSPTHCFYYEDRGHRFFVIRFDDRPAWVYDATMGGWHERSSGPDHEPWDIIDSAYCYGHWHLGDRTGKIWRLGDTPIDALAPLRRTIVSRPVFNETEVFSVPEVQIMGLFGSYQVEETAPNWLLDQYGFPILDQLGNYILADEQGTVDTWQRPGKMWVRVSKDNGRNWGQPRVRSIGKVGDTRAEVKLRSLGQYRNLTLEINLTDPVDVPLLSEAVMVIS